MKKIKVSKKGATRRGTRLLYSAIPFEAIEKIAARYTLGAQIHGRNNWKNGMPLDIIVDHMFEHLKLWSLGNDDDDHLSAIGWGITALIWYSVNYPKAVKEYRKGCGK